MGQQVCAGLDNLYLMLGGTSMTLHWCTFF